MDSRLLWKLDTLLLSLFFGVACVDVPSAPARQADLSADYAAFDHPTATLSEANVERVVSAFAASADVPQGAGAFALLRKLVSDSNRALAKEAGLLDQFTVAGSADARLPCAAAAPTSPAVATGEIALTLGVDNSKIQRAVRGSVEHCSLFSIDSSALPRAMMGTADLTLDLGADLEIGAAVTLPILVRVTNVRADSASTGAATSAATVIAPNAYELRLTDDGAVELLVQPATLGAAVEGTVVVTLSTAGSLGVRDKRGAWTCRGNHAPCELAT